MDKINVFICYGGKWTQDNEYTSDKMIGIVVPMDCTYNHLECMICSVMKVSASTQRVQIKYRVKKNLPLMEISDDISLTFYLELKRKDKDLASFPLCIDVTTVSKSHEIVFVNNIQCLEAVNYEKKWYATIAVLRSCN